MSRADALAAYLAGGAVAFIAGFRHAVHAYCGQHEHAGMEIVYHPRGAGTTTLASGPTLPFAPGDVIVYPPRAAHDQAITEPGEDVCVQLRLGGSPPPMLSEPWRVAAVDDPFAIGELNLLARAPREDGPLERLALDLRGAALLARLAALAERGATRPSDDLADRARRFVRERYATIGSVDEVAAAHGVSADYLRHVFRRRHGTSVVRWLAEVRVEKAKDLLMHSQLTQRDIARECAFANEQYFSSVFRKLTGTTPGAYRGRR